MIARALIVIACASGIAAAERVAVRPLTGDAADLAAVIEAKLARQPHITLEPVAPTPVPPGLGVAIAAFRDDDCATAIVQVGEVARALDAGADADVRGRVGLWHAAILQGCGRVAEAIAVLDVLVREQPAISVDLGTLWPSFAALVDERRARVRAAAPDRDARGVARDVRRRSKAEVIVLAIARAGRLHVAIDREGAVRRASFDDSEAAAAWTAGVLAPPRARSLELAIELVAAAGRETKVGDERLTKLGTGVAASADLLRGAFRIGLDVRAIRYAAPAGETRGGYELGAAVRAGAGVELGRRVAASGFAVAQASSDRGGRDGAQMVANVSRLGLGLGGAVELRATSRLRASLAATWIPVGLAAVDDSMGSADAVVSLTLGARLGWQMSRAWHVDLSTTLDQHETDLRTEAGSTHQSDMTIRFGLGMRHTH